MNLLFISLGCDKNLVDTEKMLGILGKEGYSFVDDENEADIVVVNTCCFIGDAKEESINTILQMAELKKNGRLKALIVTGCLAQRYKQEIIDEIDYYKSGIIPVLNERRELKGALTKSILLSTLSKRYKKEQEG